ncbi:unnamed protein product, partial [Thlaspi arvense]
RSLNRDANIVEEVSETKRSREEEVKKTEKDHEKTKTVPLYKLLAFADSFDFLLMILGTLGSIGNGLSFPIMTILFGDVVDAFGQNQSSSNVTDQVSKVDQMMLSLNLRSILTVANNMSFLTHSLNRIVWLDDFWRKTSSKNTEYVSKDNTKTRYRLFRRGYKYRRRRWKNVR